eukprot:Phypoly_transcript_22066.p1 GENE.Phypoly_transcript_22066~~Phypoly_transcript_22066.p1  ORF type:complete len:201 (+),score=14.28 Phypoly_transcript_22066:90-605(+)
MSDELQGIIEEKNKIIEENNRIIEDQKRRIEEQQRIIKTMEDTIQGNKGIWREIAASNGLLTKRRGCVVYHPENLDGGGYAREPSIGYYCPDKALAKELFGAKVGDRVGINNLGASPSKILPDLSERPARLGVIISTSDGNYADISVKWDNGTVEHGLHCAKKGSFELVYW